MRQLVRKAYYWVTGKETKWDMEFDGKQYNWKKLRLQIRRRDMLKRILGIVAISVLLPGIAFCIGPYIDKHNAAWNANSETDLAGYYLYWRTPTGTFLDANRVQIPVSASPLFDLSTLNLPSGNYFIAVSAYDTASNESVLSVEVVWDASYPGQPINLRTLSGS